MLKKTAGVLYLYTHLFIVYLTTLLVFLITP